MRTDFTIRHDGSFIAFAFDSDDFAWRPRGEFGRERWGQYAGCRWLGLSFLCQRHVVRSLQPTRT